jgi:hypothetical protein
MTVWAAGTSVHPLAEKLRGKLKDKQHNSRALVTDSSLQVLGTESTSQQLPSPKPATQPLIARSLVSRHFCSRRLFDSRSGKSHEEME